MFAQDNCGFRLKKFYESKEPGTGSPSNNELVKAADATADAKSERQKSPDELVLEYGTQVVQNLQKLARELGIPLNEIEVQSILEDFEVRGDEDFQELVGIVQKQADGDFHIWVRQKINFILQDLGIQANDAQSVANVIKYTAPNQAVLFTNDQIRMELESCNPDVFTLEHVLGCLVDPSNLYHKRYKMIKAIAAGEVFPSEMKYNVTAWETAVQRTEDFLNISSTQLKAEARRRRKEALEAMPASFEALLGGITTETKAGNSSLNEATELTPEAALNKILGSLKKLQLSTVEIASFVDPFVAKLKDIIINQYATMTPDQRRTLERRLVALIALNIPAINELNDDILTDAKEKAEKAEKEAATQKAKVEAETKATERAKKLEEIKQTLDTIVKTITAEFINQKLEVRNPRLNTLETQLKGIVAGLKLDTETIDAINSKINDLTVLFDKIKRLKKTEGGLFGVGKKYPAAEVADITTKIGENITTIKQLVELSQPEEVEAQ